jgi:hypothetical protein
MTREEAIKWVKFVHDVLYEDKDEDIRTALDMAIEALQTEETVEIKPMEIKGDFRIDDCIYCSPKIVGNVEVVVRCKDCRHRDLFSCPLADNDFQKDEDFCSWGERRDPTELPQYAEWKEPFEKMVESAKVGEDNE